MLRLFIVALVALGATFPGEVCAETPLVQTVTVENGQGEMDPVLLNAILNQVSDQTGYSVDELSGMYAVGELTIQRVLTGYSVSLELQADGGIGVLIILGDL